MNDDDDELWVPEDAGEYREGLTAILRRIPPEWGRWISCNAGWYPLITQLDTDLSAIAPDYVLHQVKEKFGGLRYYAEVSEEGRGDDEGVAGSFEGLIQDAEARSSRICELCGNAGELGRRGDWYKTLCPECRESVAEGDNQRI